jgi:Raf kinase inhibitor-like YbhB/YbcL family protein
MMSRISPYVIVLSILAVLPIGRAQDDRPMNDGDDWHHDRRHEFAVTSTTFSNGATLPLSMVAGANLCPFGGGNLSPELSWTNAPRDTRSFVVVMFDETAAFTHWGMYNISPGTNELPENAGVAGRNFGSQVFNDYFVGAEYDGPCPPPIAPLVHHYVFTVYALDIVLRLPSSANFPASAETLFQALIKAGKRDHILGSASIGGFFSGK